MNEQENTVLLEEQYIGKKETKQLYDLLRKLLKEYKRKEDTVSDEAWLEQVLKQEMTDVSEEEAKNLAKDIIKEIHTFDENYASINESTKQGKTQEQWVADKIKETSSSLGVNEGVKKLEYMDEILRMENENIAEALRRSADGHVKMSKNLDGNIAEYMVAKTAQINSTLADKGIKVEVLESHAANSVDVRVTNVRTNQKQNYQLKFGKDAKATIKLIERGNYNNQRIVVPTEQLEEIQAYFAKKGSKKTIVDHIEIDGIKSTPWSKGVMKQLQIYLQEKEKMPEIDYSHYQNDVLAKSIAKNAVAMSFQSIAIGTGWQMVQNCLNNEKTEADELVKNAVQTGVDTSIKVVTAGALQVGVRRGMLRCIPKGTAPDIISNVACVGVENVKIVSKVCKGEMPIQKGIQQMAKVTTSMWTGLMAAAKGATEGAKLGALIPMIGPITAVVGSVVGGMLGYNCGSKVGEEICRTGMKVVQAAKTVAKNVWEGVKKTGSGVMSKGKEIWNKIFG